MIGYDLFLILFFILLIALPIFFGAVRGVEWLLQMDKESRQEQEADAYIKRVMGEK